MNVQIPIPNAEVTLFDGDGRTINEPDVELTFEPGNPDIGSPRANLVFTLDLGVLGEQAVYVQVPLPALRAWHSAAQASLLLPGEVMIDARTSSSHRVVVREVLDDGNVLVHDGQGLTRISGQHLARPRTMQEES